MTTLRWTLDDLRTAGDQLSKPGLGADERARLEEMADIAHDLLADAAALDHTPTRRT